MIREHKLTSILSLAILVILAGLMGCTAGPDAPAATATAPPAATATPQSVGDTASPPTATAAATPAAADTAVGASTAAPASPAQAAACTKLNLNAETEAQLMATIPNFSSRMVREFFEYRPYTSILQFRQEIGKYVDATQVAEYEKYVYVPVDPNESDAATLMQLPGVDEARVATLTQGRPYASNPAFLTALGAHITAQQLTDAGCYLATQ